MIGNFAYSGARIYINECIKINANEKIPNPAMIRGIYFDLKNNQENIIMSRPRKTIGIEYITVCSLRRNPTVHPPPLGRGG